MKKELWKSVPGEWRNRYEVSDMGRVRAPNQFGIDQTVVSDIVNDRLWVDRAYKRQTG